MLNRSFILSKKCRYAIDAMHFMAENEGKSVQSGQVALAKNIPRKFLEGIMTTLKKKGLLQSKMGKGGGFLLKRRPNTITLLEIIQAVEGSLAMAPCVARVSMCSGCTSWECPTRQVFQRVYDQFAEILGTSTLEELMNAGQNYLATHPDSRNPYSKKRGHH